MRIFLTIVLLIAPLPLNANLTGSASPRVLAPVASRDETPTPAPSPTPDEVLEAAKREAQIADELKKKAVADKERAEAEAGKLKALTQPFGPSTVQVPTGSVQTDAAGWVESQ